MSDTVLKNPQVESYLRLLDQACARLPYAQARELREQIEAHLEEALPPDADDATVQAELTRLGRPSAIAAAAAGPVPPALGRRLRGRLRRVRWWTWVTAAVVIAAVCFGATYTLLAENAPGLIEGPASGWYFAQDWKHQVTTEAGGVTQETVPERKGQQQGLILNVTNDSDWTQTIVAVDPRYLPSGGVPVEWALGSGRWVDMGSTVGPISWSSPGVIPPHSTRVLRLIWVSSACMAPGGAVVSQDVVVSVRVGLFTRTEDIKLFGAWALSGTKATAC